MKKGFTLIELLAVIVILAIIALIATPIVLSIISDSKESAGLRSAEMYLKGLETSVATATLNEKNIADGTYSIMSNGNICLGTITNNTCSEEETLVVEMNGETPTSGTVTIENGKVTDIAFSYTNGKTIVKDNEGKLAFKTASTIEKGKFSSVCKIAEDSKVEGTNAGAKYLCEVKKDVKYNFYVLTTPQEGDTTINLIMDRNICEDGTPTDATKTEKCLVAYNSSADAAGTGPITAMTYLNNATSTWENIENLNLTYDDEGENFTGFVINGKARLPYKSEVSSYDSTNKTNAYLYDYLNQSGTIQTNAVSGIYGYWTFSSLAGSSSIAWYVDYSVNVSTIFVNSGGGIGVRAVINLKM